VPDVASNPVTVTIDNLTNGTRYYFNFTSYSAGGAESEMYGEQTAVAADTTPPPPVGTAGFQIASTTNNRVQITWIPVAGAYSYELLYGTQPPGIFGYSDNVGADTNVAVEGLQLNQTYIFGVVALDEYGNRSATTTQTYTYN
jgi:hypothetical protein